MKGIAVAICTYNNARLLERVLACLETQDLDRRKWATLVVDNNSTDDTHAVVNRYRERGVIPELAYVYEPMQGLAHARARAVAGLRTELIAFVDDDCLLRPDWLGQALQFCKDHPAAGAVGGRVQLLWEMPPSDVVRGYASELTQQDHGDQPRQMPAAGRTYLAGAGLVVRREALLASKWVERRALVGRQGTNLSSDDDVELVLRIRRRGYELWYNPAMSLDHYIPRRRMSTEYLCRLLLAKGRTWGTTTALAMERPLSVSEKAFGLWSNARNLLYASLSIMLRDLVSGHRPAADRRVAWYAQLGLFQGACRALTQRVEL